MGEQAYLSTTAAFLARAVFAQAAIRLEAERLTQVSDGTAADDDLVSQAMWRGTRARILARRSDGDAERFARESVELSLETDGLTMQADALVDLAETLRLLHRGGEAMDVLDDAIGLYQAKGNVVSAGQPMRSERTSGQVRVDNDPMR